MNKKNTKLRKLKKYLLEYRNLTWEEYLKRFEIAKPLELRPTDYYPRKFEIEPANWGPDINPYRNKIGSSAYAIKKLDKEYKITVGYKGRASKEELQEIPYLECSISLYCPDYLLNRKVIDIMQQICPEDFEAIPVTIINQRKNSEYFEIKDFYALNFLKCVDAIDRQESTIQWGKFNDVPHVSKLRYKENPWQDGAIRIPHKKREEQHRHFRLEKPCKLAIDVVTGAYIWHPELARDIPFDPYFWLIEDSEQLCWSIEKEPAKKEAPTTLMGKFKNFIRTPWKSGRDAENS